MLLDGVYLHQFEDKQLTGPPGLVGKPLTASEGFAGETVWYDALSADPFVAKCLAPVAPGEPTQCLRTVRPRQRRGGLHLRRGRADELAPVRCGGGALARARWASAER